MNFLITAGGTREYIDPVRYITNASTGKMGYALAAAAKKAGHKVTLISATVNIKPPVGVKIIAVKTTDEMFVAVKENLADCDCLIMAAAVSDYKPAIVSKTKLKKTSEKLTLELKPTHDILKWAGKNKQRRFIVGFALEDTDIFENAIAKFKSKKLDMIVANKPAAIGSAKSTVYIKTASIDWLELKDRTKAYTAKKTINMIIQEII